MKLVVYTALFGDYEALHEQTNPVQGVDYVCFTDDPGLHSRTWEIVQVPPLLEGDPTRSARAIKILGHARLKDFTHSLWIDNRIDLRQHPEQVCERLLGGHLLGVPLHDSCQSVWQEHKVVLRSRLDDPARIRESLRFHEQHGEDVLQSVPYWTAMIARTNSAKLDASMNRWLAMVMRYSRRDQLSVNYALAGEDVNVVAMPNRESDFHWWLTKEELPKRESIRYGTGYRYPIHAHVVDDIWTSSPVRAARGFARKIRAGR